MPDKEFPDKPGVGDVAHTVVQWGAKVLVGMGVPADVAESVVEIASMYCPAPLQKRQKEFLDDLAAEVSRLTEAVGSLPFASTEEFAAFTNAVLRRAAETAEREKLRYFRNALLNVAQSKVEQIDYFRNLLDSLTVDHIRVVAFFSDARGKQKLRPSYLAEDAARAIGAEWPEFREASGYAEVIFRDVWARCLLAFPLEMATVLPPGMEKLYVLDGPCLSPLGEGFLALVRDPPEEYSPGEEASAGADSTDDPP